MVQVVHRHEASFPTLSVSTFTLGCWGNGSCNPAVFRRMRFLSEVERICILRTVFKGNCFQPYYLFSILTYTEHSHLITSCHPFSVVY